MQQSPIHQADVVFGYTLRERIGFGGYGEVWKAEAPGGISKAIKLIYGYHDQDRAQSELKALNRIKDLRHPFLLSLERFDIFDGRLVIVTELADMSLKDRFQQCLDDGLPGVPRDELLNCLKDAADALDFISESHSLQHLDIKPENLLLVSGHVKVADFGLVKEIQDVGQSFMGGLTPMYAPPELFDGCPSKKSDQYSLAICYHEMLTGKRPFSGTTAAQLAAQHIHSAPDLSNVSRGDQIVLERALAKKAEHRFDSCKEMIADLINRSVSKRTVARRPVPTRSDSPSVATAEVTQTVNTALAYNQEAKIEKLSPVEHTSEAAALRPTLYVGIGKTASAILCELKSKLQDRLGDLHKIPMIKLMALDSDQENLNKLTSRENDQGLECSDIVSLPLRNPKDYRDDLGLHLSWLGRRWIYNVPRSLQTEGIRPLGRLAFADHSQKIFDRLHENIETIISPEALATASASTNIACEQGPPRVILVTSISGGVGSGMVIDMAYAIRTVLIEQGQSDKDVQGIFAYSTGRSESHRRISIANALSCLSELHHYDHCTFPGDSTCNLPPFDDDQKTFSNVYLVDMGGDLLQDEYEHSLSSIADYMYLSTITACSTYLDACRAQQVESTSYTFQSMGVSRALSVADQETELLAIRLSQRLLVDWSKNDDNTTGEFDAHEFVKRINSTAEFKLQSISSSIGQLITRRFGGKTGSFLTQIALQVTAQCEPQHALVKIDEAIDRVFATSSKLKQNKTLKSLNLEIEKHCEQIVSAIVKRFSDEILDLLDRPNLRFCAAQRASHQLRKDLTCIITSVRKKRDNNAQQLRTLHDRFRESYVLNQEALDAKLVREIVEEKVNQTILRSTEKTLSRVAHQYSELTASKLELFGTSLKNIFTVLKKRENATAKSPDTVFARHEVELTQQVIKQLSMKWRELLRQADHNLQTQIADVLHQGSFDADSDQHLLSSVLRSVKAAVQDAQRAIDYDRTVKEAKFDDEQLTEWLKPQLDLAFPTILNECSGATRLILAVPERSNSNVINEHIAEHCDEQPFVVSCTNGGVALCFEAEQIHLANIANRMINKQPDALELVERLHTRIDVEWTPLSEIIT